MKSTYKSVIPRFTNCSPKHIKYYSSIENDYEISDKLNKFEEKMAKAKERSEKITLEKVKLEEKRSQTVNKIRSDMDKRKKEYSDRLYVNLIELNAHIVETNKKRSEKLGQKTLKKNYSSTSKINKSNDESAIFTLEKSIKEKENRVKRNLEDLKNLQILNTSMKKEKDYLTMRDQLEKRERQSRLVNLSKTKIISKHLKTSKALELRKKYLSKFEQEIREKEYQFSEKFVKNKSLIFKEMQDFEQKHSFLIITEVPY